MAKRRRKSRKVRSLGLAGISAAKVNKKEAVNDLLEIVITSVTTVAAAKGISWLDKKINKAGTKVMGLASPAIALVAGGAGSVFLKNNLMKAACKGIAMGGAIKGAEKLMNKENLLSGIDEDQPLMLPGIGSYGMSNLPELPHYSENPEAEPTVTGGDPQYYMGQPSEVLSGDDDEVEAF